MIMEREQILGESEDEIELHSAEEIREVALALARQATREIYIATHDLDAQLFSTETFIDALSAFARSHRMAQVHVLVWNSNHAVKNGHRLIPLAQRLTSSVRVHNPSTEFADVIEAFMVVDGIGYFRRPLADRYDGIASFKAPLIARDLRKQFLQMWERSTPDPQLRRLRI